MLTVTELKEPLMNMEPGFICFTHSPTIAAIGAAMARAQGKIEGAKKDAANPFFKSKYADLASVWDVIREPLSANELCVLQFPKTSEGFVEIETLLLHSSGEWFCNILKMPVGKEDIQGYGSAITYARRYALQPITGVAPEDDDGNAAAANGKPAEAKQYTVKKAETKPADDFADKFVSRIMAKQDELEKAGKCHATELAAMIEQRWITAEISDNPRSWSDAQQKVGVAIAKKTIEEFEARDGQKELAEAFG